MMDDLDLADIDLEFPTESPVISEFKIVVDTREQAPFHFTGLVDSLGKQIIVPLVHKGLKSGDYSIEGLEDLVSVERKSLRDFYQSISRERDRFEREFARLNEMQIAMLVVEANREDMRNPESFTKVSYSAAYGTKFSWMIKYPKVHWDDEPGSRRDAEVNTYKFLRSFWKEHQLLHGTR